MDAPLNLAEILRVADETTRRQFIKRAALAGLAPGVVGTLLAACGPTAEAPTPTTAGPTATTGRVVPTIAVGQPGAASPAPGAASPGARPAQPTQPAAAAAKKGGTMVVLGHHEVASLSPDKSGPMVHYTVVANIHSALVRIDHNYAIVPDLAESYQAAPGGQQYTFKLRKDVKWHDGTPFTAADVKYTYEFHANTQNATITGAVFKELQSVETPDDHTVVVNLKTSDASFLTRSATTMIQPKHYHSQIGEKEYEKKPLGTGPFKVKEWKATEYTILEAYDGYHGGRPNIDAFRENIVPEPAVRTIALDTGEADSSVWPVAPEDTLRLMKDPKFQAFRAPGTAVNHFPINNKLPQFRDKKARQAMMHAINRDPLVDDLLKGLAVKATANLSPAIEAYYNPDVPQYPYDPKKAEQLLDEAGWVKGPDGIRAKEGQRLSFSCMVIIGDSLRRSEAELVQRDFKQVGIEMKLQDVETAQITAKARQGDYEMALFNWGYGGAEPDASQTLHSKGLNNYSQWSNARVDELLEQGLKETDPAKRKAVYGEIQKIVAEEVPFLFIMYWDVVYIFNKRIKGLPDKALNPGALYWTYSHKVWIDG